MTQRALIGACGLIALAIGTTGSSGATFVAKRSTAPSVVRSANDWNPPAVAIANPGSPLRGTVTLSATATDRDGVATVAFQRSPAGANAWTTISTDASAPYSAPFDTTAVGDGSYDLRAVATDNVGQTAFSTVAARIVDNSGPAVSVNDPGGLLRGTVAIGATATDAGTGVASVRIQRAPAESGTWTDICVDTNAPYSCSLDTTTLANDLFDLRAIATDALGNVTTSAIVADQLVDNVLPTATMTDPGNVLSGTVTLAASATDNESGVARVVIQRASTGSTTFTDVCTITVAPYSCRFNTATAGDGLYDFRAAVTDAAGNARTSAAVTARRIDNTLVSSVSVEDPGQYLRGTVTLTSNANSTSGVTQVTIQRSPAGANAWTTVCSDTTAPYSCSLNTTTLADGAYDFRAQMVNGLLQTTTSAVVAGRIVDNAPLRGFDVQALDAAGTLGRMQTNDRIVLTWTKQVVPSTLIAGWTGAAPASVWVRATDNSSDDQLAFFGNSALTQTTGFGTIALRGNFVRPNRDGTFNATVVLTTATVNGLPATVATITLGAQVGTATFARTWSTASSMVWTPSAGATDSLGNRSSTALVTESGIVDRDF